MEYFARNFFYNGSEPVFILTHKEIVVIDGRKWADWRFVPMLKGAKHYRNNPVYTRFLINFLQRSTLRDHLHRQLEH
jgi:hypothetical protein